MTPLEAFARAHPGDGDRRRAGFGAPHPLLVEKDGDLLAFDGHEHASGMSGIPWSDRPQGSGRSGRRGT